MILPSNVSFQSYEPMTMTFDAVPGSPIRRTRLPHASSLPEQVSLQSPVVQLMFSHASTPEQVAVQSPVVQVMLPQALTPVQVASQLAAPQVMFRQAFAEVQAILQVAASIPVIVPHAPAEAHVMSQFQPDGHVMLPLPMPVIVHVEV